MSGQNREEEWLRYSEKYAGPPPKPEYLYQCGAGASSFHIDPYGQLSVCMMARMPSFDLRQGSFVEGWREFIPQVTAQKWIRQTTCQTCELYAICNQCPGWSQIESGDQQIQVEYLCEAAHLRAQALGIDVKKKFQTGSLEYAEESSEILQVITNRENFTDLKRI
jgi:radical SAM protein with 4Fe4S-binding SPASM domain